VAQGTLDRLIPTSNLNLGIVRALVSAVFLISVLTTSFSALGQLPVTLLRPTGVMKLLSWGLYDHLVTPRGMSVLKWAMVGSLLLSTFGFLTPVSTKMSALLVIFYQGLLRSFGHFNHDEMVAIFFLVVLAFTPCGDAFSIDNRLQNTKAKSGFRYGYPIFLMMLLLAWVYFSSALIKFRVAGFNYLSADNLPALAIYHSLDNLHDTNFKFAFLLPQVRQYLPAVVGFGLAWELFFPLAIFWKRARWWILGIGVGFHALTLFFMNIFFPFHLAMYVVFVDWSKVASLIANLRLLDRVAPWWRKPEEIVGGDLKDGFRNQSF
jgi:hypothetical protein